MSSNLLKRSVTWQEKGPGRIIDTNALIAERIGALAMEMNQPENQGFTAGLKVEEVDVSALVGDPGYNKDLIELASMTEDEAQDKARQIVQEAKDAAAGIIQDAIDQGEAKAVQLKEEAKAQGYEEGKRQLEQERKRLQQEYDRRFQELQEREMSLDDEYQAVLSDLEPRFVDALTGVYEHIFHVELGVYREILLHLIRDCLRGTESGKNFQVYVSSDDFNYLNGRKGLLQEATGNPESVVEIVEDANLHKNECIIRTDKGVMDCGLQTQLDELSRKLKLLSYEKK